MSAPSRIPTQETKKVRLGTQVRAGLVRDLKSSLSGIETVVVAKIERVSTRDLNQLRTSLKGMGANFLVAKNSLSRLTFQSLGWTGLETAFEGTCAISPITTDLVGACKLLDAFAKGHDGFVLKGGLLKGQLLKPQDLSTLARLPSREVLLGRLSGMALFPLRSLATVMQAPLRSLAVVLQALKQKKEKS